MSLSQSQLHHNIIGFLYYAYWILQHSKHSWIPTSQYITSSSDLGLARHLISDRFLDAPSCKKWLYSTELRPFTAPPPHQRLVILCLEYITTLQALLDTNQQIYYV